MSVDDVWAGIISVVLAAAGGLARLLHLKDVQALKTSRIISEMFIAGFAGGMIFLLSRGLHLDGYYMFLLAGVAGWIGPKVLDAIGKLAEKATGVKLSEDDKKSKGDKDNGT